MGVWVYGCMGVWVHGAAEIPPSTRTELKIEQAIALEINLGNQRGEVPDVILEVLWMVGTLLY